jgi:nucleoside-diphosphate-sugar epimerase
MIRRGQPLRIDGDGSQTRDFIHVDDIVSANIFCMNYDYDFNGQNYDVGSGQIFSLNDIKKLILSHNNVKFINAKKRKGDVQDTFMTDVRLDQLGWQPEHNFTDDIISYFKELNNE